MKNNFEGLNTKYNNLLNKCIGWEITDRNCDILGEWLHDLFTEYGIDINPHIAFNLNHKTNYISGFSKLDIQTLLNNRDEDRR